VHTLITVLFIVRLRSLKPLEGQIRYLEGPVKAPKDRMNYLEGRI